MRQRIYRILFCLIVCTVFISVSGCTEHYNIHDLYQVICHDDFSYDYTIKDTQGNILLSGKALNKEPVIRIINESTLSVSVQSGTGLSTHRTTYCDIVKGIVSKSFPSVLGEYANNVIFISYNSGTHSIIAQDIFGEGTFYKETVLSDISTSDPIVSFKIQDDIAKIVYLKGPDYQNTEIFIAIK